MITSGISDSPKFGGFGSEQLAASNEQTILDSGIPLF